MSLERSPTVTREPGRTLLLYCPYDRRVTRHARQGSQLRLVCLDCGRGLEEKPFSSAVVTPRSALSRASAEASRQPAPMGSSRSSHERDRLGSQVAPARDAQSRAPERRRRASVRGRMPRLAVSPLVLLVAGAVGLLALANLLGNLMPVQRSGAVLSAEAATVMYVGNTEGVGVYLRRTPQIEDTLHAVADGTSLRVVGPDVWASGIQWRPVLDPGGIRGWVPAHYTVGPALGR